jgi:hypothetical protein
MRRGAVCGVSGAFCLIRAAIFSKNNSGLENDQFVQQSDKQLSAKA